MCYMIDHDVVEGLAKEAADLFYIFNHATFDKAVVDSWAALYFSCYKQCHKTSNPQPLDT